MRLIETKTLTSAQSSIEFTGISQNFTDLYLVMSLRGSNSAARLAITMTINGNTSSIYTYRALFGYDSSQVYTYAQTGTPSGVPSITIPAGLNTANTFGNHSIYFPNYTSSANKSFSTDEVAENNSSTTYHMGIEAGLFASTAAITSILFGAQGHNFVAGSTISLYGIGGVGDGGPKATGGIIQRSGGYWVHTFTSSGTFTPTTSLSNVEYVVVAGGGGGGTADNNQAAGGGGAGGYRSSVVGESSGGGGSAESRLSLASGTNYTVTIGAGGSSTSSVFSRGGNGSNSTFATITSTGGGGGGSRRPDGLTPGTGGSGGGGAAGSDGASNGAAGTANQGYAGGNGIASPRAGGGGGGAGQAGFAGNSSTGAGGSGVSSSITGSAVFRAGGGGQASSSNSTNGAGGNGGGGAGVRQSVGTAGTANTGGGGGASAQAGTELASGAGGSGIVIVRYAA